MSTFEVDTYWGDGNKAPHGKKTEYRQGLCFRCEYRAQHLETGGSPRFECGDIRSCKHACYMYKPVCPVTTRPLNTGDPRPRHGPAMISSREAFDEIAVDFELELQEDGDKSTLHWIPKEKNNTER